MVGICVAFFLGVGTTHASFEYRSVITTTNWLPYFGFGNGHKTSIAKNSCGPLDENNRRCFLFSYKFPLVTAHERQSLTVAYT